MIKWKNCQLSIVVVWVKAYLFPVCATQLVSCCVKANKTKPHYKWMFMSCKNNSFLCFMYSGVLVVIAMLSTKPKTNCCLVIASLPSNVFQFNYWKLIESNETEFHLASTKLKGDVLLDYYNNFCKSSCSIV